MSSPAARRGNYNVVPYQSTHNTGGTMMGADPGSSVLNRYLQSWDADNLFVMGAHGLTFVVDLQHQLGGVRLAVAEELLEDVCHVVHQVDRIVPDDGHPGSCRGFDRVGFALPGRSRLCRG